MGPGNFGWVEYDSFLSAKDRDIAADYARCLKYSGPSLKAREGMVAAMALDLNPSGKANMAKSIMRRFDGLLSSINSKVTVSVCMPLSPPLLSIAISSLTYG